MATKTKSVDAALRNTTAWAQQFYHGRITDEEAVKRVEDCVFAAPALTCPCCGHLVSELNDALPLVFPGGKTLDACPVKLPTSEASLLTVYSIGPCQCKVSARWAGEYAAELQSRLKGQPTKAIGGLSAQQKDALIIGFTDSLSHLYSARAQVDGDITAAAEIDRWIFIVADQIQRLCDGRHAQAPVVSADFGQVTKSESNSYKLDNGDSDWLTKPTTAESIKILTKAANNITTKMMAATAEKILAGTLVGHNKKGSLVVLPQVPSFGVFVTTPEDVSNQQKAKYDQNEFWAGELGEAYGPDYPKPKGLGSLIPSVPTLTSAQLENTMQEVKIYRGDAVTEGDGKGSWCVKIGPWVQKFTSKMEAMLYAQTKSGVSNQLDAVLASIAAGRAAAAKVKNVDFNALYKRPIPKPAELLAATPERRKELVATMLEMLEAPARLQPERRLVNFVLDHTKPESAGEIVAVGICRLTLQDNHAPVARWQRLKSSMRSYVDGKVVKLSDDSDLFLTAFLETINVHPQRVLGNAWTVDKPEVNAQAGSQPSAGKLRHGRKKRTIRRLDE